VIYKTDYKHNTNVSRIDKELVFLVNDYFKYKVNNFAKELEALDALKEHAKYNQKINEAQNLF